MTVAGLTVPAPRSLLGGLGRAAAAMAGAMVLFGAFVAVKGADPVDVYSDLWRSLLTSTALTGTLVKAAPLVLAGLAVAVPARAGLVNVGGEGQLIIGGVAAAGVSLGLDGRLPGGLTLVLMALAAALAGALWSAAAALLRITSGINEAVTTLLANYVALNAMYFLIYDPWKDANGSGQPATPPLPVGERLPLLGGSGVHAGIVVAVVAALAVGVLLARTRWGFRLRVVGGNPEAARRAGIDVGRTLVIAMAAGGALAGLGGLCQLAGAEFKLRPDFVVTYGYIAFLASWLARHRPIAVVFAATLLAALSVGGDSLQIDSQLPAACVNVLMALLLLGGLGFGRREVRA